MLSQTLTQTIQAWPIVAQVLSVPHNETECHRLQAWLDELIDEVGENEQHPSASLMEMVGYLIEQYEANTLPEPLGTPLNSLRQLFSDHNLTSTNVPELGSPSLIQAILQGQQELTASQIRWLSQRFHVSPTVFI